MATANDKESGLDPMNNETENSIASAAARLTERSVRTAGVSRAGLKKEVETLLALLRGAMYPGIFGRHAGGEYSESDVRSSLESAAELLRDMIIALERLVSPDTAPDTASVDKTVSSFIAELDGICEYLETDIRAAYEGDPAATSEAEIMLAYPAFEAISDFRIAHSLHTLGVHILPRMITEYAHCMTGIDIHPGANIGKYFFIDHGTGVVIGETCTIKDHVKLYQGVTLGARSFRLDDNGNPVKGIKRHPDIGSHVVIYAGATILGGNTVIGDNSVIGSNVWLTRSVPEGSKVFYTPNLDITTY